MDDFFINPARADVVARYAAKPGEAVRSGGGEQASWLDDLQKIGESACAFEVVDGTAVIPVRGSLVSAQIPGWFWYGGTTYESVVATVEAAVYSPEVERILLQVNSPGGTVTGCAEAAARLAALAEEKEIWSHCHMADSAAYWLVAATNWIVVDKTGEVGSIGVVMTHMDMSKMLEEWGITVTHLHAGKHKVDGSPFAPLSEDAKERLQSDLDYLREVFVDSVAAFRQMDPAVLMETEALTYKGSRAVDAGLADETGFFKDVLNSMAERVASAAVTQPDGKESTMAKKNLKKTEADAPKVEEEKPEEEAPKADDDAEEEEADDGDETTGEAAEEGASAAAGDERTRIKAIVDSPEAKGRDELAKHLAFNTDMSAADAVKTLAAAPKPPEKKAHNPLAEAMNQEGNPDLGPGAAGSGGGNPVVEDMRRRFAS